MEKEYEEEGFCLLKNFLNKQEIKDIKFLIEKYHEKYKNKMSIYDVNYTSDNKINSIHCLHKFDNTFIDFFKSKKLEESVKKLLKSDEIEITEIQSFMKPSNTGLESPLHQDNALWCYNDSKCLTAWIALDSVSVENSGIKFYKKSHKLGILEHVPSFKLGTSQTINEKEYSKFDTKNYVINSLEPGDVQFHHPSIIHGSDKNISEKSRNSLVCCFKDKNTYVVQEKYKKRMKSLLEQQEYLKK